MIAVRKVAMGVARGARAGRSVYLWAKHFCCKIIWAFEVVKVRIRPADLKGFP